MTTRRDASLDRASNYYFRSSRTQTDKSRFSLQFSAEREVLATHIRRLAQIARTHSTAYMQPRRLSFVWARQKCAAIFFDFWMEKSSRLLARKTVVSRSLGADRATWLGEIKFGVSIADVLMCGLRVGCHFYCAQTIPNGLSKCIRSKLDHELISIETFERKFVSSQGNGFFSFPCNLRETNLMETLNFPTLNYSVFQRQNK